MARDDVFDQKEAHVFDFLQACLGPHAGDCSEAGRAADFDGTGEGPAETSQEGIGRALAVYGPPNSGKTTLARDAALQALRIMASDQARTGRLVVGPDNDHAVALVAASGRQAKESSHYLLGKIDVSAQPRISQTLPALAYSILVALQAAEGKAFPRYLNAADQDALIHQVLKRHQDHARQGELCETCRSLRDFFQEDSYQRRQGSGEDERPAARGSDLTAAEASQLFDRQLNDDFAASLRSIFARMNELGVRHDLKEEIGRVAGNGINLRLKEAWSVAFELRREYALAMKDLNASRGTFNVDSSYLYGQTQRSLARIKEEGRLSSIGRALPRLVVVDDYQETTLAGAAFLGQLQDCGVNLVLITCPDEAVQTFRGSFPEFLSVRLPQSPKESSPIPGQGFISGRLGRFGAQEVTLPQPACDQGADSQPGDPSLASRISLSIASSQERDAGIGSRPWKIKGDATPAQARFYGSDREETAALVRRILSLHLVQGESYDSMAIICHDRSKLSTYASALRQENVAVRLAQVGLPLSQSPAVEGLFGFLELSQLSQGDLGQLFSLRSLDELALSAYRTFLDYLRGPYGMVHGAESADSVLKALASIVNQVDRGPSADSDPLPAEVEAVRSWLEEAVKESDSRKGDRLQARREQEDGGPDPAESGQARPEPDAFAGSSQQTIFLQLLMTPEKEAQALGGFLTRLAPRKDKKTWRDCLRLLIDIRSCQSRTRGKTATGKAAGGEGSGALQDQPVALLDRAFALTGRQAQWRDLALHSKEETVRAQANEWLDTVVRLFSEAQSTRTSIRRIDDFIRHVRSQDIAADSLARKAPVNNAVTLLTPAGAAGGHWDYVFLPRVQDGIWPNLALRDQLFAADDLADVMFQGKILDPQDRYSTHMLDLLQNEKKSFLLAVTRARKEVFLTAVKSEDEGPSDFFSVFLPGKVGLESPASPEGGTGQEEGRRGGEGLSSDQEPVSPHEILLQARSRMAYRLARAYEADSDSNGEDSAIPAVAQDQGLTDAAQAMALLADEEEADPSSWSFYYQDDQEPQEEELLQAPGPSDASGGGPSQTAGEEVANEPRTVYLSPSAVDSAWSCPVCYLLDRKMHGPSDSSVATSYGTLIHKVAQIATEQGLDKDYGQEYRQAAVGGQEEILTQLTDRLMAIYQEEKAEIDDTHVTEEVYRALSNDAGTRTLLQRMAFYFLESQLSSYARDHDGFQPRIGKLLETETERTFTAHFTMEDIRYAYNRIPDVDGGPQLTPVSRRTFLHLLDALVGGFPFARRNSVDGVPSEEALMETFYQTVICLKGSIDRLETRLVAEDGPAGPLERKVVRIIDYKTGHSLVSKDTFNDLQLICYQLGLVFEDRNPQESLSEKDLVRKAQGRSDEDRSALLSSALPLAQADLFPLALSPLPACRGHEILKEDGSIDLDATRHASSFYPELTYQPAIFEDGAIAHGPASKGALLPRPYYKNWGSILYGEEALPDLSRLPRPDGTRQEEWKRILADQSMSADEIHGPATTWALAMIGRVFYAASLDLADKLDLSNHPPRSRHLTYCSYRGGDPGHQDICPACSGFIPTVMQERERDDSRRRRNQGGQKAQRNQRIRRHQRNED